MAARRPDVEREAVMTDVFQGRSGRIPRLLIGCSLLFAGCPAGPSTPAPGTPEPQQRTGDPPARPDFLDGPTLSAKQLTPEQMAERERKKSQMISLMDLTTAPPLEAADLLETAMQVEAMKPGEYGQGMLRHHGIRIFYLLMSEEILDDALARAVLRLGERLRPSGNVPLTTVVKAMVKSHDHLGEPEKGDALVDVALEEARKPRQVVLMSTATRTAGTTGVLPRVITVGGGPSTMMNHEWRRLLELKAMRLARQDFAAADSLLQAECQANREVMVAQPDDVRPVSEWLALADLRAQIARMSGQFELADKIDKEREETVRKVSAAHPDSAQHFALLVAARNDEVGRLLRHDPMGAKQRLTEIQRSVERSQFAQDPALTGIRKSWEAFDRMIAVSQFRHDLIGRPAPPFDVKRWVHGEPRPLESLRGRVVLLAFCQINRAATVELYPWLNSLHEEWHDRGLEIIQVVRPIHMTWNAKAKRAEQVRKRISLRMSEKKIPDVTDPLAADGPAAAAPPATTPKAPPDPEVAIEAEVQMLEQLATHYGHRFSTLLCPTESTMPGAYGDTAPPSMVAIDKQGNVRAIETFPTQESRQSIREQLDRLLAE